MSCSDRILAACCPDSPVDAFDQAARVTEVVSAAHLARFTKQSPPPLPAKDLATGSNEEGR